MQIWTQAANKAKTTDGKKVAETIKGGKWDTVLGPISYDKKGDITTVDYVFYKWGKDGKTKRFPLERLVAIRQITLHSKGPARPGLCRAGTYPSPSRRPPVAASGKAGRADCYLRARCGSPRVRSGSTRVRSMLAPSSAQPCEQ